MCVSHVCLALCSEISPEGVIVTISVDISASSDISFQILFMVSVKKSTMIESLDVWCRSTTGRGNNYVTAGYTTKNVRTKKCATLCAGAQRWIVRPATRDGRCGIGDIATETVAGCCSAVPCRSIEFSLFQIILSKRTRWLLSGYFSTWCDSKFINTSYGIFKTSIIWTDEKIIFIFLYGISIGFWLFSFTIFSW